MKNLDPLDIARDHAVDQMNDAAEQSDKLLEEVAVLRGWNPDSDRLWWEAPSGMAVARHNLPRFITSVDACMELVNEMRLPNRELTMWCVASGFSVAYYDTTKPEFPKLINSSLDKSLPLAICRSYIKWKRGKQ